MAVRRAPWALASLVDRRPTKPTEEALQPVPHSTPVSVGACGRFAFAQPGDIGAHRDMALSNARGSALLHRLLGGMYAEEAFKRTQTRDQFLTSGRLLVKPLEGRKSVWLALNRWRCRLY